MTVSSLIVIVACLMAGVAMGVFFFLGLWWTVTKLVSSRRRGILLVGSSILRMFVVLAAMYVISSGHIERLVSCVIGMLVARLVIVRVLRPQPERCQHD